jgi:small redox-active disulfide protein 2
MRIGILGSGCPNCRRLEEAVRETCRKLGLDAEIVKVTDWSEIASYGAMRTPALAVDGVLKAQGRIPSEGEIRKALGR